MDYNCARTLLLICSGLVYAPPSRLPYEIEYTGQSYCYKNNDNPLDTCPALGEAFYGQDPQFETNTARFAQNIGADGNPETVTDRVTGLTWVYNPGNKMTLSECEAAAAQLHTDQFGGYRGWRVPNIKELYSLINFDGVEGLSLEQAVPFIDTSKFMFTYGDEDAGERWIDAQALTSTIYVGTTMQSDQTLFGVNFADGRIKGYPVANKRGVENSFYCYPVRGRAYGVNAFVDNGDGTITDSNTGLMWMQADSGALQAGEAGDGLLEWKDALTWATGLDFAGHSDWRLPTAKELHSIVDYTRSPETSNSAAIDPMFTATQIQDEGDNPNWAFYWSSTTHKTGTVAQGRAAYFAFGQALGWMDFGNGYYELVDVHGAGSQRSDPKTGDPSDFPLGLDADGNEIYGHGPQGDVIRIKNMVRAVRFAA